MAPVADSPRPPGAPAEAAFFEGDLVLHGRRPMMVLHTQPHGRTAVCVWYEGERRHTGSFTHAELELIAASPLRSGYRLVRAPD